MKLIAKISGDLNCDLSRPDKVIMLEVALYNCSRNELKDINYCNPITV